MTDVITARSCIYVPYRTCEVQTASKARVNPSFGLSFSSSLRLACWTHGLGCGSSRVPYSRLSCPFETDRSVICIGLALGSNRDKPYLRYLLAIPDRTGFNYSADSREQLRTKRETIWVRCTYSKGTSIRNIFIPMQRIRAAVYCYVL